MTWSWRKGVRCLLQEALDMIDPIGPTNRFSSSKDQNRPSGFAFLAVFSG
jgi:hypothetical protein